jgi:hypothetical protein
VLRIRLRDHWIWLVPLIGTIAVVSVPLLRHVQKRQAETAAIEFLRRVHIAQHAFRSGRADGGYASDFASLTVPCAGKMPGVLTEKDSVALNDSGYQAHLRRADGAVPLSVDCHGRTTVSDYYAAVSPASVESPGQQAFATTAAARIFVFFDGIAPLERDMTAGLATPLDALDAFKIP